MSLHFRNPPFVRFGLDALSNASRAAWKVASWMISAAKPVSLDASYSDFANEKPISGQLACTVNPADRETYDFAIAWL